MKLVQKLTAKTLGWSRGAIEELIKDLRQSEERPIGRVAGIATGFRRTLDDNGEIQIGLKGNFRGISLKDNSEVTSGVCYLPSGIQAMIEGALAKAQEASPSATLSFAMDIYVFPENNKAGYSYRAENLIDKSESDPLDMLLSEANEIAALPMLAAPETKTGKKETE